MERRCARGTLLAAPLFATALACIALGLMSLDAAQRSPEGRILFVGSSIFHRWTNLAKQMDPLPVVNRGVDGFQTSDVLRMVDSVVLPAKPTVVVYYAGSNDVDAGDSADTIVGRIRRFVDRVTTALPSTRIVFVSVNRAPEKEQLWNVVDAVNRQVAAYAAETSRLQFVDVNPVLFRQDGTPRFELYMPDGLHLRPAAYEEFARILKPILSGAFQ